MYRLALLATAALAAVPARAQDRAPDTAQDRHEEPASAIIVTAPFARNQVDVLSGTSVVAGGELTRDVRPSIGETLARQPGVSSTAFGPSASRPILRGFSGERVRVLTDGIGSFDVSNTSADHATIINPLTAERIEVLRGPAALLFGSSAIGGVVNVIDSRIPRRQSESPLHLDGLATYGSAADERSGSAALDVPVTATIVVHADGSYSKTDDLRIGGHVLTPALRAQAGASGDPDIAELASLEGRLPNTAAETWEVAGGAAIVAEGGNLGFSVSHYDSLYGVPVRYSLDPAVEAEAVRIDVNQTRVDLRGEVDAGGGFLKRIRSRFGAADYRHTELEEDGTAGTRFFAQGYEGRVELVQQRRGGWEGAIGGQFFIRDMNIVGDEKFLPRNETFQAGIFTLQAIDLGVLKAEVGARFEHADVAARADADIGNSEYRRRFDAVSLSAGASYAVAPGVRLGVNVSRSERAPSAEELFADGPHAGTQAYEIGNPDFTTEKATGVEATVKGSGDGWSLSGSAYATWFRDYIYDSPTGLIEDDLPVFQYRQADARYLGFELEGSAVVARIGDFAINADALADYVHANIVDGGPVPRIPPLRVLGGLEAQSDRLTARVEVEHAFAQSRVAAFETHTPGHTILNAALSWKPIVGNPTTLSLSANNITDAVVRRHSSVLKDYAPLAGRDIRVTARFTL